MLSDVLIPLRTHPVPDTIETATALLRLASSFATHATLSPLEVAAPSLRYRWSGAFTGLTGMGAAIETASREASSELMASISVPEALQVAKVPLRVGFGEAPVAVTGAARHHDLTMISFSDRETGVAMAEAAIFGTGRPAMLIPGTMPDTPRPFAKIAIAWDGSATASRALYDAMPLIVAADEVVIINAPADKPIEAGDASDLSDYLVRHGVAPKFVKADVEVQDIGLALQHSASSEDAGLLVMGAFGHSRVQQFILGGATRGVLSNPRLPILMSHS